MVGRACLIDGCFGRRVVRVVELLPSSGSAGLFLAAVS